MYLLQLASHTEPLCHLSICSYSWLRGSCFISKARIFSACIFLAHFKIYSTQTSCWRMISASSDTKLLTYRWKRRPCCPISCRLLMTELYSDIVWITTSDSVDNEVVRELGNCHGEIDPWLWIELLGHSHAFDAFDFAASLIRLKRAKLWLIVTYNGGAKARLNPVAQMRISTSCRSPASSTTP